MKKPHDEILGTVDVHMSRHMPRHMSIRMSIYIKKMHDETLES